MALTLTAKPDGAEYTYTYTVPVADGDSVASYTLTETGCTIVSDELNGNDIEFLLSGGVAGVTGTVAVVAVTNFGETLVETLYIPIRSSENTASNTVSDVIAFAVRPLVGYGADADADLQADGLETLNAMISLWRIDGLDIGIPGQLALTDDLVIDDAFLTAVKYNLRVAMSEQFGRPVVAYEAQTAAQSKALVGNVLFNPADLTFEPALRTQRPMAGLNDL